jgi:hypothetical protein
MPAPRREKNHLTRYARNAKLPFIVCAPKNADTGELEALSGVFNAAPGCSGFIGLASSSAA